MGRIGDDLTTKKLAFITAATVLPKKPAHTVYLQLVNSNTTGFKNALPGAFEFRLPKLLVPWTTEQ